MIYDTSVCHKDYSFIKVRFGIMKDIAARLNTFLKLFLIDAPMVSFLSYVLEMSLLIHNRDLSEYVIPYRSFVESFTINYR